MVRCVHIADSPAGIRSHPGADTLPGSEPSGFLTLLCLCSADFEEPKRLFADFAKVTSSSPRRRSRCRLFPEFPADSPGQLKACHEACQRNFVPDGVHRVHNPEQFAFVLLSHSFKEFSTGILYCSTEILAPGDRKNRCCSARI